MMEARIETRELKSTIRIEPKHEPKLEPKGEIKAEQALWYKNAIIYELHIRAFHDSNADGTGDFLGLVQKLDYLCDLGVTAIWLLPFYPSPLKDDGYDIADYRNIHPDFGCLDDFKYFLREAHRRGLKVITELVINHTSDQHEWFRKSRKAPPGSPMRDFYVWTDNPNQYSDARIIFKDFETSNWTWDPVAKSYYWHRFYSHQPDLNFENPAVQKAIFETLDYWLEMGVDGLRLDAIPYLYERESTSCENLPETHDFLKKLRKHVDERYPDRMLLAEANQWPEDAIGYFGDGDECHMCFHFPLMPRLFMAIRMEDRYSIVDILKQTPEIPSTCQWATFLRNHDELTLEMVTDEERDYMYKVYASDPKAAINLGIRRRLAPLVENDRRQIELLNALLFSLPGTPVIYYGDEIGMGDNIYLGDRNGVRTPFQWSSDRNAGFSHADPQSLYLPLISSPEYHYATHNVETAQKTPTSLLWWMKKMISIRKAYPELSSGQLQFIESENMKVVSFVRSQERTILVVANLSHKAQYVELNLSQYKGYVPFELLGRVKFPPIEDRPFFLTLGPYAFYWFELKEGKAAEIETSLPSIPLPAEFAKEPLEAFLKPAFWERFEPALLRYLPTTRWFLGKKRPIFSCTVTDVIQVGKPEIAKIFVIEVAYHEGLPETYVLPLAWAENEHAHKLLGDHAQHIVSKYTRTNGEVVTGVFYEAILHPDFARTMVQSLLKQTPFVTQRGSVASEVVDHDLIEFADELPEGSLLGAEQSNSSFHFNKKFYFKLYRKLESGENPEIKISRHFAMVAPFANTTTLMGVLDYQYKKTRCSLGCLQSYIENQGDGWHLFLGHLSALAETAGATLDPIYPFEIPRNGYVESLSYAPPEDLQNIAGSTFALAQTLGKRTAEMHLALATSEDKSDFTPEPFTPFFQRSLYQSFRNTAVRNLARLRKIRNHADPELQPWIDRLLESENEIYDRLAVVKDHRVNGYRTVVHGDFHLGQVLYTGKDFFIVDFEGEPKRSLGERRLKRSPLSDVAGMIRSFDYLSSYYLKEKVVRPEDRRKLASFIRNWNWWISSEYLKGYLDGMKGSSLIPQDLNELQRLLDAYTLEKALYELGYEIDARPDWLDIPLKGILKAIGKERL